MDYQLQVINGEVYLTESNDSPTEDDWGSGTLITSEQLLRAARRFLNDGLIIGALKIQSKEIV